MITVFVIKRYPPRGGVSIVIIGFTSVRQERLGEHTVSRNPNSKTHALMTRIGAAEGAKFEDRCAAEGLPPAEFLRRLVLRELGMEPANKPDPAEALLRLFVETMRSSLEDENSPNALTLERFENLVEECVPGFFESEAGDAQSA
jgi:hypothetical protein